MVSVQQIGVWILVYTVIAYLISSQDLLSRENVNISGPLLTIRSQKGLNLVERLSKKTRLWKPWGIVGIILAVIGGIIGVLLVFQTFFAIITRPESIAVQGPSNVVVIPGVNPFLPLAAAPEIAIGLILGLVVHEGGHAIMCRVGDIDIDSTGVILFSLLPLGAFVEPNEDSQENAALLPRVRMFSAGIMNNVALTLICIVLLYGLFAHLIVPAAGIGVGQVYDNSPASQAGIEDGDGITAVNGTNVSSLSDLQKVSTDGPVEVTLASGRTVTVDSGAYVVRSPQGIALPTQSTVTHVDGNRIHSPDELEQALQNTTGLNATITLANGTETRIPVGVYSSVTNQSSFADQATLSEGQPLFILSVNNTRVYTPSDIQETLPENGTVAVTYWNNGEITTTNITVESDGLGIVTSETTSSVQSVRFGFERFPAEEFISLLQFSSDGSLIRKMIALLALPIAGTSQLGFNFPGFTPFIQSFYTVTLLPSSLSGVWFFISSALFWTAWVNINLALFNCIPTYALDGGHILRSGIEDGLDQYLSPASQSALEHTIKGAILILLIGMIFGPLFI